MASINTNSTVVKFAWIFRHRHAITPLLAIITVSIFCTVNAQTFQWGAGIGGLHGEVDLLTGAKDHAGNVYLSGIYGDTADFDPGPGIYNMPANPMYAGYLQKVNAAGHFVWAKMLGGMTVYALAIDTVTSHLYCVGLFFGTQDFDPGSGIYNLTAAGSSDIAVVKLDTAGNFIWARQMGGPLGDQAYSATVDRSGNLVLSGFFQGTSDFDPGPGTVPYTSAGNNDIIVVKLNAAGDLVWAKAMGGAGVDVSFAVTVDDTGNVYYNATFSLTMDADPGPGIANLISSGARDLVISKLDSNGNYAWAGSIGGLDDDFSEAITIGNNGDIYLSGGFKSTADMDPGPASLYLTPTAQSDGFVLKLNPAGNLVWAKQLASTDFLNCRDVALDSVDNVFVTGGYEGTADFDPGPGTFGLTAFGYRDAYLAALDVAGNFKNAWQLGADSAVSEGVEIFAHPGGYIYAAGVFRDSIDLNPGAAASMCYTAAMSFNAYLIKLRPCTSSSDSITVSSCISYTSPSGNHTWTASGTYLDTIPNSTGCDSVLSIDLTILPGAMAAFSSSINLLTVTFTLQTTGATNWSWDFGDGNTSTAQNPVHTYAANGTYTVCLTVADSACTHTLCQPVTVIAVGMDNGAGPIVSVYPNPSSGLFHIHTDHIMQGQLFDAQGKVISIMTYEVGTSLLDLSRYAEGIYFLRLQDGDARASIRLVKLGDR